MRQKQRIQPTIQEPWLDHEHAKELQAISCLLADHPNLAEMILQDLVAASGAKTAQGAWGLTADQVLRCLILKQLTGFSYRDLEYHLGDSLTYRRFCGLGFVDKPPSKSALQAAIKAIRPETLEKIHLELMSSPVVRKMEPGQKVRVDCSVVGTDIHEPQDSWQLLDCVRVLTRLLGATREILGSSKIMFSDRTRSAKRRHIEICHGKSEEIRNRKYQKLIRITEEVCGMANEALAELKIATTPELAKIRDELSHYLELAAKVLWQTQQRVFEGKSVPAGEKVVSIFEEHTDVIVKDRRQTLFGHKVCLTGGRSSMILDCQILEGNPADSTLAETMIDRLVEKYGQPPRQAAFDGGFASRSNLAAIKAKGVEDVVFSKRRGIKISEMAKSAWVFRQLKKFRAGIEGVISYLKRIFGLDRCTWRSFESFKSYVWSSILSFNLVIMARHLLS